MHRAPTTHHGPARRQRGAVLITGLIFLVVLTLIAVSGASNVTLEERMAGSQRDAHLAFQSAESALRDGESWLGARLSRPVPEAPGSGCTAPCDVWQFEAQGDFPDAGAKDHAWWQANARAYSDAIPSVGTAPRYVLEERMFVPDTLTVGTGMPPGRFFYRITARGTGGTDVANAQVQATYVRRF